MENMTLPTPPSTQPPGYNQLFGGNDQPVRHKRFYRTDATLVDPVILQVRLWIVCCQRRNNRVPQAENTLYRLSRHGLTLGSNFFASALSINSGDPQEGKSDEHPIVLPATVKAVDFEVFLSSERT